MYRVFHRTWWKRNNNWPNGLEPCAGTKHTIDRCLEEETARELCKEWNNEHEAGELSDKAEYEEV